MSYTAITSFNKTLFDEYGHRMVDSFLKFWPESIDLWIYAEDFTAKFQDPRIKIIDMNQIENLLAFKERHKNNPKAHGNGNNFKFDAVRFCHKVFSIAHACANKESGWIIWVDGDVVTHSPVTYGFVKGVSPEVCNITYLGRSRTKNYSECGWVGYNISKELTLDFVDYFEGLFVSDEVFDLKEWHDSYVFDEVRKIFEKKPEFTAYDLGMTCPDYAARSNHIFINSVLGKCFDHQKGARKKTQVNKRGDLLNKDFFDHPYWAKQLKNAK